MRAMYGKILINLTNIIYNANKHGRKLVCLACEAIGYSPRDCTTYFCVGCSTNKPHKAGHLKFTRSALVRHKKNATSQIPFCCVDCTKEPTTARGQKRPITASAEPTKTLENYDASTLLRTLRHKDSWRCTCKNTRPPLKMKARSAITGKSHDPKCMLQKTMLGERRWDGKNLGITLEQLKYLADRNLY